MTPTRRVATIPAVDVAGYSRLLNADENDVGAWMCRK
jgi:hypothetical protein